MWGPRFRVMRGVKPQPQVKHGSTGTFPLLGPDGTFLSVSSRANLVDTMLDTCVRCHALQLAGDVLHVSQLCLPPPPPPPPPPPSTSPALQDSSM